MFKFCKRIPIIFLCFSILGFAFLSIGGDFLHEHVHHDHDVDQECPFYKFLLQLFIVGVIARLVIKLKIYFIKASFYQFIVIGGEACIIHPRGPPLQY